MVAPRICQTCLYVVEKYDEKIGNPRRCPNCGKGLLTKYIQKVIERVDDPEVLKMFGVKDRERMIRDQQEIVKLQREIVTLDAKINDRDNASSPELSKWKERRQVIVNTLTRS